MITIQPMAISPIQYTHQSIQIITRIMMQFIPMTLDRLTIYIIQPLLHIFITKQP